MVLLDIKWEEESKRRDVCYFPEHPQDPAHEISPFESHPSSLPNMQTLGVNCRRLRELLS